jgi:hypothetical protein
MSDHAYADRKSAPPTSKPFTAPPAQLRVALQAERKAAFRASVATAGSNRTGLPDGLKTGIEALSGISLADVRVHRNSSGPSGLGAEAFARGSEIHLAPGHEAHLPHEAWHVVQQKQGRVRPTLRWAGVPINDDGGLEREADAMAAKAAGWQGGPTAQRVCAAETPAITAPTHQLATDREQRRAARRQRGPRSRYGRSLRPAAQVPLNVLQLGNQLRVEYRRAGRNPGSATHFVYFATSVGRVVYVGITNDVQGRQAQHGDRFHLHQLNRRGFTRIEVRAIEQAGINRYRRDPRSQNIAESIAARHRYYAAALRFGRAFVQWAMSVSPHLAD